MRRPTSSPRALLAVLTGLALLLLCVPEAQADKLRGQALSLCAPVFGFFAGGRPVAASRRVGDPQGCDPRELEALTAERDRYKHENVLLREQLRQHAALRQTAPQNTLAARGLAARVIARQTLWQEPLLGIDRGTAQDVRPGAGVLYRGAAYGRVISAGPQASCVALLTHSGIKVAVRLAECRAEGALQGIKEAPADAAPGEKLCRVKIVAHDLQAREGEPVVTSGLDGSFPPGCLIGTVARIERSGDMEWSLLVRPAAAAPDAEAVFVLTTAAPEVPWPQPNRNRAP